MPGTTRLLVRFGYRSLRKPGTLFSCMLPVPSWRWKAPSRSIRGTFQVKDYSGDGDVMELRNMTVHSGTSDWWSILSALSVIRRQIRHAVLPDRVGEMSEFLSTAPCWPRPFDVPSADSGADSHFRNRDLSPFVFLFRNEKSRLFSFNCLSAPFLPMLTPNARECTPMLTFTQTIYVCLIPLSMIAPSYICSDRGKSFCGYWLHITLDNQASPNAHLQILPVLYSAHAYLNSSDF